MATQPTASGGSGTTCPHCRTPIYAGQQLSQCPACGTVQHSDCWARNGGCGKAGCSQSHSQAPATPIPPTSQAEERVCPTCGYVLEPLDRTCPRCEWQRREGTTAPPPSAGSYPPGGYGPPPPGAYAPGAYGAPSAYPSSALPPEIGKWNWGAFSLNWIWCAAMEQWGWLIAILIGGPLTCGILSLVGEIYLGIKGNELAWQSRHWRDAQHFSDTQRVWNTWGLAIFIVSIALGLIAFLLALLFGGAGSSGTGT